VDITKDRSGGGDGSSSTYQLAESPHGSTDGVFEVHARDNTAYGDDRAGMRTTITTSNQDASHSFEDIEMQLGIRVNTETVQVVRAAREQGPGNQR